MKRSLAKNSLRDSGMYSPVRAQVRDEVEGKEVGMLAPAGEVRNPGFHDSAGLDAG